MSPRHHSRSRFLAFALLALVSIGLSACMSGPRLVSLDATVVPAEPLDLPPGAQLTVRLEDVSRADAGAEIIAESTYTRLGQGPIPVVLRYTAGAIDAGHRYALRAQIRVAGELTHASNRHVAVLIGDAPDDGVVIPIEGVRR
ncbi:putative lipoprotein [Modicisalibacter muralis]|uniref:Putative lipoprotein n=1 Tax=Modicisalibacter muralis TaxID=119000 RepID=A0A1G9QZU7_9GAMM|nr:YbaY family lipoprotein [Halomonas muralis]SDM16390.1 putative lipoprotein [Halomonas muralis]